MPRYDLVCPSGHELLNVTHSIKEDHPKCMECGLHMETLWRTYNGGVEQDSIEGGLEIQHGSGIINPDGSPKRYYSKTELRRACNEAGWSISGDTPKPYKVAWSGRRKTNAGLPLDPHE